MKIVVISQTIYPCNVPRSFRATELAKYFAKESHDVYLYASLGKYDYSDFESKTGIHVRSLGKTYFSTFNSDSFARNSFFDKVARRLFGKWIEYPDIELLWKTKKVIKSIKDVDLLVTVGMPYPIHWGAAFAKVSMGDAFPKVWVSDCGDPYMGNTVGGRKHPNYFWKLENFWGRQTDYITIPVEEGRKGYSQNVQDKIRIIPQGFDFENVKTDVNFKGNQCPRFAYAGTIYEGYRDPTKMLQYLITQKELKFQFVVYTNNISYFERYKEDLGEKLLIKTYIPRDQLIYELSKMDFVVNLKNQSTVQSPSKLIDYYLTGRPILDISTDFTEKEMLDEFLNGNYSKKHIVENADQFDIRTVGIQFLSLAFEIR